MTTTATALDPKFAKIIALMNSTKFDGERQSCRARAEQVAKSCGMSFEEAMEALQRATAKSSLHSNFYDDYVAAKEAADRAERERANAERRRRHAERQAAVIAKYGSKKAVLAPCERERLILEAVKPWRVAQERPHERWTGNLGGWSDYGFNREKMPPQILEAILRAYPLPTTFAAAKAEHEYWETRNDDMDCILDTDGLGLGDIALDVAAGVRAEAVRDLALREIRLTTIADLHARFAMYRGLESTWERVEDAIFRDLEAMAKTEADLSNPSKASSDIGIPISSPSDHPSTSDHTVADMLRADPTRSDRHVARACGCSPTTVGKIRRQLGLAQGARSVQRRGQTYRMKVVDRQAVTP
ncbi:hypothetical protein [Beijerinckia sp. L45]|uniref:hypothetical protein n=1 Tax=Beijerinckia sp. L45 TaxID=1641855 RepID=UPI00131DBFC1|nr:hypothetical protein [Beijerinckia sp. L45]